MKIEKIKIINFKGIDQIESDPRGHSVYLLGPNASDKSSFIDAAWSCMTGKNLPPEPIKKGKSSAEITVDLGEFVAITKFKRNSRPTFTLTSKQSGVVKSPRNVLNELLGVIDFNPTEFFALTGKQQVEYFCEKNGLDIKSLDDDYQEIYDSRAFDKKELDKLKNALEPYDKEYVDKEFIVAADFWEKYNKAEDDNRYYDEVNQQVQQAAADVKELEIKIESIKTEIKEKQSEMSKRVEWLTQNPQIDTEAMKEEGDSMTEGNEKIRHAKENAERDDQIVEIEEGVKQQAKDLKAILEKKGKMITESINIEEMEFDGEFFLFEGLPFDDTQINTASQIIAGLKMGLSMLKDVRIMRFEGSLIDKKNAAKIRKWSKENDIQLFVEIVDRDADDDKLQIFVEEE